MKLRYTTSANLCLFIMIISLALQSCKKEQIVKQPVNLEKMATNKLAINANSEELYVSTVHPTPTIPFVSRIATGPDGTMYISSYPSDKVFKITVNGNVSVLAQNINSPSGIKVAKNGNVYVALFFDNKILKITPAGVVDTLRFNLTLNRPTDIAIADDYTLYIADGFHKRIIKVNPKGVSTVLAGKMFSTDGAVDGTGASARFNYPNSLKLGADGFLWVTDTDKQGNTCLLRRITTQGTVKTVINTSGKNLTISEIQPAKVDEKLNSIATGNVFVLYNRNTITQYNTQQNTETTIFKGNKSYGYSDGPVSSALSKGMDALSYRNNVLYFIGSDQAIRKISE